MKKEWTVAVTLLVLAGLAADAVAQDRRGRGNRGRGNRAALTAEEQEAANAARAARAQQQRDALAQQVRPIDAVDSVWIENLTWMEVRDAVKAGKTTAIVATGGIEPNGPYLVTGKHNVVLQGACEGIARTLGNALVAPIIKLVPEGSYDPPTSHMLSAGTLSLRQETFEAVLFDVGSSLVAHGFEHVIFIGDSGGNQSGMGATAAAMNEKLGKTVAHFIPEFYDYASARRYMETELGVKEGESDGFHDDFVITAIMMTQDPVTVRWAERMKADKASINAVSIADKDKTVEIGKKILKFRVDSTVAAIKAAIDG
jgi:creatinine amidohydrolase/Fe(II)-dependent formamide hydrolase-like protein